MADRHCSPSEVKVSINIIQRLSTVYGGMGQRMRPEYLVRHSTLHGTSPHELQANQLSSHSPHQLQTISEPHSRSKWYSGLKEQYTPATPDPWIFRKLAVMYVVVVALSAWSFYVVVGKVCVPAIQGRTGSRFGTRSGIAILAFFLPIWLIFVWSYIAVVTTSPGYARDFVITSNDNPIENVPIHSRHTVISTEEPILLTSFEEAGTLPNETVQTSSTTLSPDIDVQNSSHKQPNDSDMIQRPLTARAVGPRWCLYCKIIKPDRTHHCRHCGKCVMQFDHHCLWIGQCIGWANHGLFITFNLWSGAYCLYVGVILIIFSTGSSSVDGQSVALIVLCFVFFIFTHILMLPTHIHLILSGKSTIESFQGIDQRQAEDAVLQREYGVICGNLEKRKVRRQWDVEWGGVPVDARWAFGRKSDLWKQEMGTRIVGWILPLARPLGDGLHFTPNPRFGPNGEWLRKQDWPKVVAI